MSFGSNSSLLPLTRQETLKRPQREDTPCCALIAALAGYLFMKTGARLMDLKTSTLEKVQVTGEEQYLGITAPGSKSMGGKYARGSWILSEDALNEMKMDGKRIFNVIHSFTGHHFSGKLPDNIRTSYEEFKASGAEEKPNSHDSQARVPLTFCHLLEALMRMDELAANLKKPLAANIDFCGHTTGFVACYVDEETTNYYIFDSHRRVSPRGVYPERYIACWGGSGSLSLTISTYFSWVEPYKYESHLEDFQRLTASVLPFSSYTMEVYELANMDSAPTTSAPRLQPTSSIVGSGTRSMTSRTPSPGMAAGRVQSPTPRKEKTPPADDFIDQLERSAAAAAATSPPLVVQSPSPPTAQTAVPKIQAERTPLHKPVAVPAAQAKQPPSSGPSLIDFMSAPSPMVGVSPQQQQQQAASPALPKKEGPTQPHRPE